MKTNYIFIIIAIVLGCSACDDFLTPDPSNKYADKVAFSSEENTKLYVNTFYPILSHYGLFGTGYLNGSMYVDGLTDIEKTAGSTIGSNGAIANLYATTPSLITTDQNSLDIWSNAYYNIRLMNEFLDGIDQATAYNDSIKNMFKAEVHFF